MSAPENPPAFPSPADACHPSSVPGMSLRDWFAGRALAGFMANTRRPMTIAADDATWCYTIADAMLAERAKAGEPAQPAWIERKVRKDSDEYRAYLRARFPFGAGAPSPFDFDGHKWRYLCTRFDDLGEFDVIHRPNPEDE